MKMKKLLIIVVIILMLGAVFGVCLHQTAVQIQDKAPVIAKALDFMIPAIAYADGDTINGPFPPPPPPPPPIW